MIKKVIEYIKAFVLFCLTTLGIELGVLLVLGITAGAYWIFKQTWLYTVLENWSNA